MGVLLTSEHLGKSFNSRPLFNDLQFVISEGERIGLIGPNGAGKSTLLRILAGELIPDEGSIVCQRGLKVAHLSQQPEFTPEATIHSTLLEGASDPDDWTSLARTEELLWKFEFEKAQLKFETPVSELSGGWRKRLALARALMKEPDLLLMDEPTNHLDVEGILWLEGMVAKAPFATLTITHDRLFLYRVANRIIEIDRRHEGGLLNVRGDYGTYLEVKEAMMTTQENREVILKGVLRRETQWLKAGAKARTTKQQARIHRHADLSEEVSSLSQRNIKRSVQLEFQSSDRNPKLLLEAKKLSKSYEDRALFIDLDLTLTPGTRLGILGENGCGKSSLIRVLLGTEPATSGTLFRSDQLKVCYFEQHRESLDPKVSLMRAICPYGDHVHYRGRQTHIRSYLERFLFSHDQMDLPISRLSGGEQSRVLIAKLMLQEANLLVLDEPTNDLDIPTLNVLQECLIEFEGALIIVSHDRFFLDQVSTEILAFPVSSEGKKQSRLISFADLSQWETWHAAELALSRESRKKVKIENTSNVSPKKNTSDDNLIRRIEKLEQDLKFLENTASLSENQSNFEKLAELGNKMTLLQSQIADLYNKLSQ